MRSACYRCATTPRWRTFWRSCANPGATSPAWNFPNLISKRSLCRLCGETSVHGFLTLFYKENLRFWKVGFQTVAAPILTAMLYLLIFSHVLKGRVQVYEGV